MEDFLSSVVWLSCCCLIIRCSIDVSRRCFPDDCPSQQVLHASAIAIAAIVFGLTVSGACGVLSPGAALILPVLSLLVVRHFVVGRYPWPQPLEMRSVSLAAYIWSGIAAVLVGHTLVNGVMKFPTDWDTLMYHLPYVNHWLQTGSFAATETPRWSNPANSEVLGLWFAAPFSGDFLVPLNNLPVMVVWIAATIELGRRLGMSGWWPHLAAIACIAVHTTVHETDDASNDLMVPAFFLASLAYAIRFRRSENAADIVLFGASLGLLVGTKFFAAGYGLLSGLAFAAMCFDRMRGLRTLRYSIVAIGISLLFGGYWYARNFLMTGHVFYPQGSEDLHRRIPHPDLSRTTLAWNGDPRVPELFLKAVRELCGPVHFVFMMLLPSVVAWMLWTIWSRESEVRKQNGLLLLLLIGTAVLSVVTPMLVEDQPGTLNHLRWGTRRSGTRCVSYAS